METTSFSEIFDRAIFHFRELKFNKLNSEDRAYILMMYMFSALAEFCSVCQLELPYDRAENVFTTALTEEQIEILSLGTAFYWLDSKAKDDDTLHNRMYTKDASFFSPANLRREINSSWKILHDQWRKRIVEYSYMHSDLSNLKV